MNGMKNYLSHGGETELDKFIQVFRAKVNFPIFYAQRMCSVLMRVGPYDRFDTFFVV